MRVERTFKAQINEVGDAVDTGGPGVRVDIMSDEPGWSPRWTTIVMPISAEQAKELGRHLYRNVAVTIAIEVLP